MTASERSCLVQKLSHYVLLNDIDKGHLARLEREERSYPAHYDVRRVDDPVDELFVIKSGWIHSSVDMPDGRRQIVKLHHPGDIVGLHDIAFRHATTALRAVEPVCLCPFPKSELDEIFTEAPRLAALILMLSLRDNATFMDLVRAMGRMSARERMAYMLLELHARLAITDRAATDTIRMPLTQSEIGDLLGLTNVYVSRTLTSLEADGYIRRSTGHVRLLRPADMARMCDFQDRHTTLDTHWFPRA